MIRGTTPTFVLNLETDTIDLTEANNVYISLETDSVEMLKQNGDEGVEIQPHQISVYLTQAETLQFAEKSKIEIQVNWTYANGSRGCTDIARVSVGRNLVDKVLP